jgi:two-component system sensor histidine kinase ChvG
MKEKLLNLLRYFYKKASGITARIMVFNLLLVFLPMASVLYLDVYESELLKNQEYAMVQEGRILAAALSVTDTLDTRFSKDVLSNLKLRTRSRLRVIDTNFNLIADSSRAKKRVKETEEPYGERWSGRNTFSPFSDIQRYIVEALYDLVLIPVKIYRKLFSTEEVFYEVSDFYSAEKLYTGVEIKRALKGYYGAATRFSPDGNYMLLYSAIPVSHNGTVTGVVLVSQSTVQVLKSIYQVRKSLLVITALSGIAAILFSVVASFTITRPLKNLSREAQKTAYRRGKLFAEFKLIKKRDEIGALSRSLKDLTERLARRIRFVESFSADVSHEFKNPLASIRAAAEVSMSADDEKSRKKFTTMIFESVNRLEKLIGGLRELGNAEHAGTSDEAVVDLVSITNEVIHGFSIQYPELVFHSPSSERILFQIEPDLFVRVLENLIGNAASFSKNGDTVTVALSKNETHIFLTVSDDGPGIPEENLPRLFNRFFTFRPEDVDSSHTGLGLSIVLSIVESYNGSIKAANSENGGATFVVLFPV